jgi:DNA invertase Pin-like site-specific DNA recombinase
MSKGQRVGYVRVSSVDQTTERQLDGIEVDRVFTDKVSGKDTKRPHLASALEYVRAGDTLVVHSLDRLARNVDDLRRIVRELNERGVSVEFVKNNLTFSGGSDPSARLMLTMLGAFAEFERDLLRERQREGIAIAKAKGVYKGRKRALNPEQVRELREMARQGLPKADLARAYSISRETLYQYLRLQPPESPANTGSEQAS